MLGSIFSYALLHDQITTDGDTIVACVHSEVRHSMRIGGLVDGRRHYLTSDRMIFMSSLSCQTVSYTCILCGSNSPGLYSEKFPAKNL